MFKTRLLRFPQTSVPLPLPRHPPGPPHGLPFTESPSSPRGGEPHAARGGTEVGWTAVAAARHSKCRVASDVRREYTVHLRSSDPRRRTTPAVWFLPSLLGQSDFRNGSETTSDPGPLATSIMVFSARLFHPHGPHGKVGYKNRALHGRRTQEFQHVQTKLHCYLTATCQTCASLSPSGHQARTQKETQIWTITWKLCGMGCAERRDATANPMETFLLATVFHFAHSWRSPWKIERLYN